MSAAAVMPVPEAVLVAEGLSRRYGRREVVHAIELALTPGSVLGLVGANGAGKSTLIGMLAGHVRPSAGRVRFTGGARRSGDLGVLPQGARLPTEDTPLRFMTFVARLQRLDDPAARARAMLDALGLRVDDRRRIRALSEGERKLVAVGQAFLGDPPVVLLDEPTSALDPWGRRRLRVLVRRRRDAGGSILIASHNLGELEHLADEVAIMAGGRLLARGSVGTMMPTGLEIRIELARGQLPEAEIRAVRGIANLDVDAAGGGRELVVTVSEVALAESVVAEVVRVLERHQIAVRRIVRVPELEQILTELVASKEREEG